MNTFAKFLRKTTVVAGIGALALSPAMSSAQTIDDPALQVQPLVTGLSNPTTMAFIAPNDILVLQKNDGRVRRVIDGALQAGQVLDLAVDNDSERGLLGIALHPSFTTNHLVYLYFTQSTATSDTSGSPLANVVYRYEWNGSALVNPSLVVSLPVTPGPNHDGGIIVFGPDGKLYVVIGDLNRSGNLQNHPEGAAPDDTSVILRLNDDGSVPADNPFHAAGGNLAKYYAYGIRNSFGMAFDPLTNKLWMTENGPDHYDEINLVNPGFNSGWNQIMGPDSRDPQGVADLYQVPGSQYSDPKFSWLATVGPTGIAFLDSAQLGAEYQNNVFVGDINNGTLYRFKPNAARDGFVFTSAGLADLVADSTGELDEVTFGTGFTGITDLKVGPDGLLYVVSYSQGKIFVVSRIDGAADLVETAVSAPAAAAPGTNIVVSDTVQNAGQGSAAASTTHYYLSLDTLKDAGDTLLNHGRSVPSLAAGASSTGNVSVAIPSGTPLGTYRIIACADDTNTVAQSNDGNNCAASAAMAVTEPDLVEVLVSNPPAFAAPGGSFSVTDTAKNNGTVGAKGTTTRYYFSLDTLKDPSDALLIHARGVPALAAGASSTGSVSIAVPSTTASGTYHLLACADDTAVVAELSETNNCVASATTVVVTRPDLIETSVSDPPANPVKPGDVFSVTDTAKNQGQVNAAASGTRYYLSLDKNKNSGDRLLSGTRSVPLLAPSTTNTGTRPVTIPTSTPLGTYYLLACADDSNNVVETDDTNNCVASANTVVVTRPDLVETAVSNPPATAAPGSSFTVTDTTRNVGTIGAGASTTRYYLSDNATQGSDRILTGTRPVDTLAAGASIGGNVTVTIPPGTPAGSYFLLACADDRKAVIETDEANNCRASATKVTVGP